MKDYYKLALRLHKKTRGKLAIAGKVRLETQDDLSTYYTPGVAEPARAIARNPALAYDYTMKGNAIAVISDGSANLGLGNTGGLAALPVLEGKCLIFKQFAGIDAFPIVLGTQDPEAIIETIVNIAPGFGAINLEDIAAPHCFHIEKTLSRRLLIPVVHDDQHCTAIVTLAGLKNAAHVVGKNLKKMKIVINGAGAAGTATATLLVAYGIHNVIVCDRRGAVSRTQRPATGKQMNSYKNVLAHITNPANERGALGDVIQGADAFVGLSAPNVLSKAMVASMSDRAIVFALANPDPEISFQDACAAGAYIVATGRSDFPNQINNALAFPGFFRGLLDGRVRTVTTDMKLGAASAIAGLVKKPTARNIIPSLFDTRLVRACAHIFL